MENENRGKVINMRKVFNPTLEDLHFTYDSAPYVLKAGEEREFVDYVAEMASNNLADRNVKTNDPAEHKVLMGAYLENSEPEVIAQRLGIDLTKIRREAMTKEHKEAKVGNLEAEVEVMKKEMAEMKAEKELPKEEVKVVPEEDKLDKRTKEYKESVK